MRTIAIAAAIILAATVAGARDYEEYLAYNSTPVQKSAYQAGYEAGLAACSCSGGAVPLVFIQAQPTAPTAQPRPDAAAQYMQQMRQQQQRDDALLQQRMQHTSEQSTLHYLNGGKVLE